MKILPKEGLRAVDIRDTLTAHGADWSNVEGNKSANYLPNYFREEAKINKWSRYKPVVNKAYFHEDFDYPKNVRATPNGQEKYGITYRKKSDYTDIHEKGWKYTFAEEGYPLRLHDFANYYPEANPPIAVSHDKFWQNRINYVTIDRFYPSEHQISIDELVDVPDELYFGFVVDEWVRTVPIEDVMEFRFDSIISELNPRGRVTAILHKEKMLNWTNIVAANHLFEPITFPNLEGELLEFDMFKFISDIQLQPMYYDLHCGLQSIVDPMKEYAISTTVQGTPPKYMTDGFDYKVTYSGIVDDQKRVHKDAFIPYRDLQVRGGSYTYTMRVGMIMQGYNTIKHFKEGKKIDFDFQEVKAFGEELFDSENFIAFLQMTMRN